MSDGGVALADVELGGLVYLACLLGGIVSMLLIDRRLRLYLFADVRRALLVQGVGVAVFLVWDLVCIALGIFGRGPGPHQSGIELVPHLTLEEPFFLWFLCHFTMILFTGVVRLREHRTPAPSPARPAERA